LRIGLTPPPSWFRPTARSATQDATWFAGLESGKPMRAWEGNSRSGNAPRWSSWHPPSIFSTAPNSVCRRPTFRAPLSAASRLRSTAALPAAVRHGSSSSCFACHIELVRGSESLGSPAEEFDGIGRRGCGIGRFRTRNVRRGRRLPNPRRLTKLRTPLSPDDSDWERTTLRKCLSRRDTRETACTSSALTVHATSSRAVSIRLRRSADNSARTCGAGTAICGSGSYRRSVSLSGRPPCTAPRSDCKTESVLQPMFDSAIRWKRALSAASLIPYEQFIVVKNRILLAGAE
jgi:hypothetical protein